MNTISKSWGTLCKVSIALLITYMVTANAVAADTYTQDPPVLEVLRVTLEQIPGTICTKDSIPLRITFENVSSEKLRLRRLFSVGYTLVLFVYGGSVEPPFPIVSFKPQWARPLPEWDYIELKPRETFGTPVDIADKLPKPKAEKQYVFTPGKYTATIHYMNGEGENCFKGAVESNALTFRVEETRPTSSPPVQ